MNLKKLSIVLGIILLVLLGICVYVYLSPIHYYLQIMKNINRTETKIKLRDKFDRDYNYTELLTWEHERLEYTEEPIERYTDPVQILEYGKGRCEEFSILYVALCLAHGYQSRLVVDIFGDHVWAEVNLQDNWTHVDPTEKRINDPYMYERDWNKNLMVVYAFEDGRLEDVTNNYKWNH